MLEVNDFNAVRITLASPEKIRDWSYGEVTKPETINYRTLKPEKDGLFDERIFGPTKDFECYCGKYKRVRYKGIICDKCGVEVTRAKVRRERMGHIELASPVAHIWFVKGTPSRLGLLLDISPRALERVLYFAQYIITHVDEEAKQRALEQLRGQVEERVRERTRDLQAQINTIRAELDEQRLQIEAQVEERRRALEAERERRVNEVAASGVSPVEAQEQVAAIEREIAAKQADLSEMLEAGREAIDTEERIRTEPLFEEIRKLRAEAEQEFRDQIEELENEIRPRKLHNENKIREWQDRYQGVFRAGMGAEAILEILKGLDLNAMRDQLQQEINSSSGQRRKKATKRLRIVEALRKSGNRPEWMIFTVLPVLPPELRPMVQLDGGRFATSDLNDLYRRVINRNNRLKRLLELGAPEIIIRNEKRMLQEAVDSLIDNGRRGRAVSGSGNHKLKSLSDMLKGKQGRFRQNLLGKRVDYSGRSVIVVGPELKLHQCGLPKRMALELFKPFVMHKLVAKGLAHNIKSAKRIVERARPEVWDVLEEVIKDRPVLLNRAPTLHRLGIQAFEPVLIDGSAIQIHPLVCSAFNADFDGDQMAVHVPLSRYAVAEARQVMLSTKNLLLPASGEPTVAPTLDMVLGCYYMTLIKPWAKGAYRPAENGNPPQGVYGSFEEAKLAHDLGAVELQAPIRVRDRKTRGKLIETTVGRIVFNEVLPEDLFDDSDEMLFFNTVMDKKELKKVVARCYQRLGNERTAEVVDEIKRIGFEYATRSGITIAMNDIRVPERKQEILAEAERQVAEIEEQYQMGLITDEEKYEKTVKIWNDTTDKVTEEIQRILNPYGSIYMMSNSGAKGNIAQIRQMAGMRGLMTDPTGRVIDLPIRSSFREGLSVLEYFISTHGARKGLADTALRTADSGYLTRRLIDVAQDVIIFEEDCGTEAGIWVGKPEDPSVLETMQDRIIGRLAASPIVHPQTGEVLVDRNEEIDEAMADRIVELGIEKVHVRSPLSCEARRGLCRLCYGRNLATGKLVNLREAVGIIAAQSIGEPGTQLTMRTFHTGGVASQMDITSGLPRVDEIFEARRPKGQAILSEIDGVVEVLREGEVRKVRVISTELYRDEYHLPEGAELLVTEGQEVEQGTMLARPPAGMDATAVATLTDLTARISGRVHIEGPNHLVLFYQYEDRREYVIPAAARLLVENGQMVHAGDKLTEGAKDPQDVLIIQGREAVQLYLVEEVQKVYRSQGVNINDKHIEVIVRQMLRRVQVDTPGDTQYLPGELIDRFEFEETNRSIIAEGGEPATARPVLLGVTKASLSTDSFLAAASFQETTRVLTEAAIKGAVDRLLGLKENVIIGKLIPAQAPIDVPPPPERQRPELPQFAGIGPDGRLLDEGDATALAPAAPTVDAEALLDEEERGPETGEEEQEPPSLDALEGPDDEVAEEDRLLDLDAPLEAERGDLGIDPDTLSGERL
ncbi:MAG: DNA-directed RNA polymerase subunit beta' [Chloroflexota bacterium]